MPHPAPNNDQPPDASRVLPTKVDDSDRALVARVLEGETACFGALVERYQRVLYNVALRTVGDRETAQDVTQVAFVKAYQNLDRFDRRRRFFSWIYRIAMNEALNVVARRRPHAPVPEDLPSPAAGPAENLDRDRQREALLAAVDTLSPEHHQVIVLRYFVELSYREIAETLEIEEKTVKSRLYEARRNLAERLTRRGAAS